MGVLGEAWLAYVASQCRVSISQNTLLLVRNSVSKSHENIKQLPYSPEALPPRISSRGAKGQSPNKVWLEISDENGKPVSAWLGARLGEVSVGSLGGSLRVAWH